MIKDKIQKRMREPKLEPRSQWAADILERLALGNPDARVVANAQAVLVVLRHGMKKHARRKGRGARVDLIHAAAHIHKAARGEINEADSGLPHEMHAAADCLLAFGDLVGLSDEPGDRGSTGPGSRASLSQ